MAGWNARGGAADIPGRQARRSSRSDRDRDRFRVSPAALPEIERALGTLPAATWVMTSAHENRRGGVVVTRVMRGADEPPCVCVAVPTGQKLATLIRDSRAFGLCVVDRGNRLLMKKFAGEESVGVSGAGDAFDLLETRTLVSGSPLLARSPVALDCEVIRHFDLEADYEIYVGSVLGAFVNGEAVAQGQVVGALSGELRSGGAALVNEGRN
jgi:flavin reductase (DIM6/NTAB) family NADH-FMN oxidoreductase RutF